MNREVPQGTSLLLETSMMETTMSAPQKALLFTKAKGTVNRYTALSCLHKEIRRSDLTKGMMWVDFYKQYTKPQTIVNYVTKILFEETKSLYLFEKFRKKEITGMNAVNLMFRSRKKWELPYYQNHFVDWLDGFYEAENNKESLDEGWMKRRIMRFSDLVEAYKILYFTRYHKKDAALQSVFWEKIEQRAVKEKNERLLKFIGLRPGDSHYNRMMALELTLGFWEDDANDIRIKAQPDEYPGLYVEDYALDRHNYHGISRLLNNWGEVAPNKDFSETGVDLRWTGQLSGIYWRFECYRQKGHLTSHTGEDVQWTDVTCGS